MQTNDDSTRLRRLILAIDLVIHGKQCRYEDSNSIWFSRASGKYMSLDDVLEEVFDELARFEEC